MRRSGGSGFDNKRQLLFIPNTEAGMPNHSQKRRLEISAEMSSRAEEVVTLTGREIERYLAPYVQAVQLPVMFNQDETYPALILDGASGVGKTQQAFALLKAQTGKEANQDKLVYLLMSDLSAAESSQRIYKEMDFETDMLYTKNALDEAIVDLDAQQKTSSKDMFSVENLQRMVHSSDEKGDSLKKFVAKMFFARMWYDKADKNLKKHGRPRDLQLDSHMLNKMKNDILFADEALPKNGNYDYEHANRLRFVRNLGRALGMRTVLAGTAASAANMLAATPSSSVAEASRSGDAEQGWVQCVFVWQPISDQTFLKQLSDALTELQFEDDFALQGFIQELKYERPLMSTLVLKSLDAAAKESKSWPAFLGYALKTVGKELKDTKKIDNKAQLVWLSGAWLAGTRVSPSHYLMKGPELVKHHFFEPCISTQLESCIPFLRGAFATVERRSGPIRVCINREKGGDTVFWAVSILKSDQGVDQYKLSDENSVLTTSFQQVEYAIKNCVQQCLAREPLLACALSTMATMNPHQLHKAIEESWNESMFQQTSGKVDGEIHEHASFIALQLACNAKWGFPCTVLEFIDRFISYMSMKEGEDILEHKNDVKSKLGWKSNEEQARDKITFKFGMPGLGTKEKWEKLVTDFAGTKEVKELLQCNNKENNPMFEEKVMEMWDDLFGNKIKEKLTEAKMPWLIPACSKSDLRAKMKASPSLLSGLNVAGLVPGEQQDSPFDAKAYPWENDQDDPEWVFEFKARRETYSLSEGKKDLEKKIYRLSGEGQESPRHAILVAVSGMRDSQCCVWLEGAFFRIVLLVSARVAII
ncbi:hypothetical protein ACA910_003679 [Epithemia clementina (nom. ined.)]